MFIAWQLTNECSGRCLGCCEQSGPGKAWRDELSREAALELADRIIAARVPYVAFGGGEPLGVPHCWTLLEHLSAAGIAIKLETDGMRIDEAAADRLAELELECIQISLDGATAATHEQVRPGSSHAATIAAIERLVARHQPPQAVFVPNRFNLHELLDAYDQALRLGCAAFVTGPLMRIGRAAARWTQLGCTAGEWTEAVRRLRQHHVTQGGGRMRLDIYPRDIVEEMQLRVQQPQAMLLIVPNGCVKLLNALPFTVADLRHDSLQEAWRAYQAGWSSPAVRWFVEACNREPQLLRYANDIWMLGREDASPQPTRAADSIGAQADASNY